jgi:tetratricopeptide (TPR) repeat protein
MLRRKNSFLLLLLFSSLLMLPQSKEHKKQVKKHLKEGQVYFYQEDYYKAWQAYRKVLQLDAKNEVAGVNGVICIFKLNYSADSAFAISKNLAESTQPDAKFYLAKIRQQQRSFDEAIALLEAYNVLPAEKRLESQAETDYLIQCCRNAKIFMAHPLRSIVKNMGQEINSPYSDYVPVILPDESAIYFTSRRAGSSNNKKDETGSYYEDVYVSYKQSNQYNRAQNIGTPVNSETNDACVAISPDGQRMIIYRTSPDLLTGDLYISKMGRDKKWGEPEKMGKEINSEFIETSACFSNDTSEIYFSSNRPGGFGGKDIYRVRKTPSGQWAMPFNLGPAINTERDDDAPFLHPDGITLYFSSQGHNTMGGYDVFKSLLDPATNQFSEAENLGYPINDVGNDIFFVLNADGQRGYYSSIKKETFGGNDIYQIDTRFGENDLSVKKGKALIDNVPGRVRITLMDNENNEVNGNYYSDPSTGRFILVMNPLKSYKAIVENEGCETLTIDLKPMAQDKTNQDLEFKMERN